MTVEELRVFIYAIANKDQTGDMPTPAEYNSYLARANEDLFRYQYGLREQRNNVFYQNSQDSTDFFNKFITAQPINATLPGIFTIPSNYVHASSMAHVHDGARRSITILNEDEWNASINNPVTPPTAKYAIASFIQGLIRVMPASISQVELSYIRRPVTPVWGFTIVNDEAVYNPATSVQIEYEDIYHIDMARIILSYMGITFRDADLLQYAEIGKQAGR